MCARSAAVVGHGVASTVNDWKLLESHHDGFHGPPQGLAFSITSDADLPPRTGSLGCRAYLSAYANLCSTQQQPDRVAARRAPTADLPLAVSCVGGGSDRTLSARTIPACRLRMAPCFSPAPPSRTRTQTNSTPTDARGVSVGRVSEGHFACATSGYASCGSLTCSPAMIFV